MANNQAAHILAMTGCLVNLCTLSGEPVHQVNIGQMSSMARCYPYKHCFYLGQCALMTACHGGCNIGYNKTSAGGSCSKQLFALHVSLHNLMHTCNASCCDGLYGQYFKGLFNLYANVFDAE